MRIKGAGGCQDIRLYETDFQTAWQLIFDCMGQCGIEVQQVDNEHHVAHGRKKSMYYDITLRDMEDGTVQIYFDQHKKYIEVYSFRNDTNTMDQFSSSTRRGWKKCTAELNVRTVGLPCRPTTSTAPNAANSSTSTRMSSTILMKPRAFSKPFSNAMILDKDNGPVPEIPGRGVLGKGPRAKGF